MGVKQAMTQVFRGLAFHRVRSLMVCIGISTLSLMSDLFVQSQGLFAASGAVFTLGGFLLNLKQTAIFHRQAQDGTPLPLPQKYYTITSAMAFAPEVSETEMRRRVETVEADEIWGCLMVVGGTLLWGYGEPLMKLLQPFTACATVP